MLLSFQAADMKWSSFDEYRELTTSIWVIVLNVTDLDACSCTCPIFLKKSHCKHTLGMKIRKKLVDVPAGAKDVPIGRKRKRGRPTEAKWALMI